MELKIPSSEQAYWGLRAMKTVAMADGALDASEHRMMEAVQRVIGTTHAIEELAPITPAELAQALPDPQIRGQLVQGLIVMSLIDGKASPQEADLVEQFAQALEVSIPEVKNLRHVLRGEIVQLRLDMVRRVWLRPKVKEIWNKEGIRGIVKFVCGMLASMRMRRSRPATRRWNTILLVRWGVATGSTAGRTDSRCQGKRAVRRNRWSFTIARTSYPAMERILRKKSRSPASVQAFSGTNPGSSCSLSCCNSMWASA